MVTIVLITVIFLLINGLPYIRIWLGHWPWEHGLRLLALGFAITFLGISPIVRAGDPPPDGDYTGGAFTGRVTRFSILQSFPRSGSITQLWWHAFYSNTIDSHSTTTSIAPSVTTSMEAGI
jgi:hypothetical protein